MNKVSNMDHKHQGYRFENDWEMEVLESDSKSLAAGITLPVLRRSRQNTRF